VEHGLALHKKFIICDTLCSDPKPYTDKMIQQTNELIDLGKPLQEITRTLGLGWGNVGTLQYELEENPQARKEYLDAWERSGVTSIGLTLPVLDLDHAYRTVALAGTMIDIFRDSLIKVNHVEDIRKAKKEGKHALLFQFQRTIWMGGFHNLEQELGRINAFYKLGVRTMQLTYNLQNLVGCGCTERHDSGLTHFGVKVVERMNEVGMLVDVSHCGHTTTMDAVEVSKAPVAATHTTCYALCDFPRGKTDEAIKTIAEKDGYIGITGVKMFTVPSPKIGTLKDWLDHIDHAVNLVGADHVGIASDHWHRSRIPERLTELQNKTRDTLGWWSGFRPEHDLNRAIYPPKDDDLMAWANWPNVTIGLVSRGYSDREIEEIVGGSFIRTLERIIG
jgi:membrane dipeptidase